MDKHYKRIISRYVYDLFSLNHVVGVGYGPREKRGKRLEQEAIVVMVDKKVPKNRLDKKDIVPTAVEEYGTDVIEVGDLQLHDVRIEKMRPAKPGVSIGHYKVSAGTLGAIVKDKNTEAPLILSNNHVLANITNGHDGRARIGDPVLQPGAHDSGNLPNDLIGRLERFIPVESNSGTEPTCPVAISLERLVNSFLHLLRTDYDFKLYKKGIKNRVDCAVARPVDDKDIDASIIDVGTVKGTKSPEPGLKVKKSGRTSGITEGKIRVIDATVEIKMSQTETAIFTDQFVTEPISKPGDSGSLVLDNDNRAVGLLFAGSAEATVCNWINNVLEALKIKF